MKHFLFNLTKNTAKEARITGGGASQVGTESRELPGNPRLYTYSQATLKRLWRYVAMIFAVLTLSMANVGIAWGASPLTVDAPSKIFYTQDGVTIAADPASYKINNVTSQAVFTTYDSASIYIYSQLTNITGISFKAAYKGSGSAASSFSLYASTGGAFAVPSSGVTATKDGNTLASLTNISLNGEAGSENTISVTFSSPVKAIILPTGSKSINVRNLSVSYDTDTQPSTYYAAHISGANIGTIDTDPGSASTTVATNSGQVTVGGKTFWKLNSGGITIDLGSGHTFSAGDQIVVEFAGAGKNKASSVVVNTGSGTAVATYNAGKIGTSFSSRYFYVVQASDGIQGQQTAKITGGTDTRFYSYSVLRAADDCDEVDAPTSLSCTAQTQTSLTFGWTKASDASGYVAKLWDNSSCTGDAVATENIANGNTETVTFSGLTAGTTYYCKVQSKGDGSTYCATGGTTSAASGTTSACTAISPTWSYPFSTVAVGITIYPTIGGNTGGGTVTYSSSATSKITNDCYATAAGSATLTANVAANGVYCSGSVTSGTITVVADQSGLIKQTLTTGDNAWGTPSAPATTDGTNITSTTVLSATNLTISGNGNTSNDGQTAKITGMTAGSEGDNSSKYMQMGFTVKSGKQLNVSAIYIPVQPVSSDVNNIKAVLSDGETTITGTLTNSKNGKLAYIKFDSYGTVKGNVTLTLYAWGWTGGYRLGKSIVIDGEIEDAPSSCTAPDHVGISGSWRYFPGQTISLTATGYDDSDEEVVATAYQWQKEVSADNWSNLSNGTAAGVTISGATSSNLQISNCGTGNTGNYRCIVSTGATCSTTSSGFGVKIYTLNGAYDDGEFSSNNITFTSGTTGTATVHLAAGRVYKFKVTDNFGKWFGNSGGILEPAVNWDFSSGEDDNCVLFTGPEGDYTFTVDFDHVTYGTPEVVVSVAYPSVTHPAAGYAYFKNVDDWEHVGLYMWYEGGGSYTDWGSEPWVTKTTTICGDTYYYTPLIPSWYNRVIFREVGGSGQTTDITVANLAAYSGKYNDKSDGNWHDFATYTISFDGNSSSSGSMSDIEDIAANHSQTITSNAFSKTGYAFAGWKANADVKINGSTVSAGTVIANGATLQDICGDIELTAQWDVQSYNLTWDLAGGTTTSAGTGIASGVSVNTTSSVAYGTSLTAPTVTKANYDFSAWSPAVASTMPAAATTYTATWTAQTHDVAFTLSNAAYSSGTDEGSDVATYGTNYSVTFAATSGYIFPSDITVTIGGETKTKDTHYTWDSSTGELTVTGSYITGDIAVSITALEDVYRVTYSKGSATGGTAPTDATDYDPNDSVVVKDTTGCSFVYAGYTFRGWTDGTTFYKVGQKFKIISDVTLTAVWEGASAGSYTYTFESSQPGNPLGTYFDITTSAVTGHSYEIAGSLNSNSIKASDLDGGGAYFLGGTISTSDVSATYKTKASYTNIDSIAFYENASDNGKPTYVFKVVDASTGTAQYTSSTLDHKTIKGSSGTNKWTGRYRLDLHSSPKTGKIQIEVTSGSSGKYYALDNITVYYKGNDTNFDVSFNMKGHGSAISSYVGVPNGKKILKPADPEASGYIFGGWYTDAACTSAFSFSGTITKDTTLYAKWTEKSTPTKYNVTGEPVGLCGEETATITLEDSDEGISYQLKKNGKDTCDAKAGTGSALEWEGMEAGVYTVWTVENATYKSVQMDNSGYTTVTVTDLTPASVSGITSSPVAANTNILTSLTVTATGDDLEYQWQTCTDDKGTGAADLTSGSEYSGFEEATLNITATSAGTRYFRCKVSGTCGDPAYSDVVTVNITASYLLTYDANNGSGAPDAVYLAAGSTTLSSTIPTYTSHRFLGWNTESDGSGTRYAAGASFTMPSAATTLHAEWQEVATLTWNLLANTKDTPFGTHGTSGNTSTNTSHVLASNMTDLASEGIGLYDSGKSAVSGKTAALVSTDGKDNSKYVYVTFQVATNYEFVPTSLAVPVSRISNNSTWDAVLTDGTNELKGTYTSTADGNNNIVFTNVGNVAFMGTVTLKIWAYRSGGGGYRLVTPITISGDINYVCPERATITSPTAPQSIKLYTDQSKTLTVAATAYSSGTLHYQWKKDGVNIVGATSASHTVYGSIDGTAGETYVYTCDVTQTSPDACATVTSPAVSITFASTSCGDVVIAGVTATSKNSGTPEGSLIASSGGYKVNLQDWASPDGGCGTGGKIGGDNNYIYLTLKSGEYFQDGDKVIVDIAKVPGTGDSKLHIYDGTTTLSDESTMIGTSGTPTCGENEIVLSGVPANTSSITLHRGNGPTSATIQNPYVISMKVYRYGCPDIFIYDDAAGTHEWSDEDNWIGPAGHGSGLPTSDDRIFINKSVTVDVATASAAEMHITNGSMVTVEKSITVGDVIIETGSTLNIAKDGDDGILVATNSLYLKGGWNDIYMKTKYDMPRIYIDPASTLTKEVSTVNFDISVDHYNYYPIAVPFRVKVKDVDYANSLLASYSNYGVTGQYVIKEYDGERRAEKGPDQVNNWKVVPLTDPESGDDVYLEPGRGYIMTAVSLPAYGGGVIRFPLSFGNAWTALGEQGTIDDDYYKNVIVVSAWEGDATKDGKNANKGWNLLGVPFMSCYATSAGMYDEDNVDDPASIIQGKFNFEDGTWDGEDPVRYVNVPVHDFSEYIQTDITDAGSVLRPGWCFFVQIETGGNLTFLTADQAASSSLPIYAPRREQTAMPTIETGIILSDGEKSDKTTFLVSDKYSATEYEINADLEKLFGNGYTLATYSLSGETRLAYNALSNADAANIIPIGYRAPADGEYTFSINPRYAESDAFEHINLIDYTTGIVTDLLQSSYTFSTERTQNDARFALNVVPRQETPTDLEDVQGGDVQGTKVRKMIINDQLFIIRDGQMYDATGRMVK